MNACRQVIVLGFLMLISVEPSIAGDVCDREARETQIAGCSDLQDRHKSSGFNSIFPYPMGTPFHSYISNSRKRIKDVRAKASYRSDDKAIAANSPFQWQPDPEQCVEGTTAKVRGGVLLIHGLTDSPFLMQDVGRHFQKRCYLVRAIVLPGHGTIPGDLLDIKYGEWLKAVHYGIRSFKGQTRPVLVVGFSTGAAAALHSQLENESDLAVDGLILLSPALEPKSPWSFLANWHRARKMFKDPVEYAPKRWLEVATDEDYAKYESFPKDAGDQIHELSKAVRKIGCSELSVPVFMAVSSDDDTVKASSAIECFKNIPGGKDELPGRDSLLLLYTNEGASSPEDDRTIRHESKHLAIRVIDFSHTAIPVAPSNAHYGLQGDYQSCMHYLGDRALLKACKSSDSNVVLGEKTEENLKKHTMN